MRMSTQPDAIKIAVREAGRDGCTEQTIHSNPAKLRIA